MENDDDNITLDEIADAPANLFRHTLGIQLEPTLAEEWMTRPMMRDPLFATPQPRVNLANHDPERRARAINCTHCNGTRWVRRIYGTWSNTEEVETSITRQAECPTEPSDERSDSEMWECGGCGRRPDDPIYQQLEDTVIPARIGEV